MSFAAIVKDEAARVQMGEQAEVAELAAMVRVCGTIAVFGHMRYRLSISTETGAVARTAISLLHKCFNLRTELTVRRSVLHKTSNYLITVPDQPQLAEALVLMDVLNPDLGLAREVNPKIVADDECARAYLRGAFLAGGSISDPRSQAHFELVAQSLPFANGLVELMGRFDISARVNRRRSSLVIYLKSFSEITEFLALIEAPQSALQMENMRVVKSLRNDTNRLVNAEIANQRKASDAASSQVETIRRLLEHEGIEEMTPALRDFCELRLAHPELSLRELGEIADPPLSKSAVYHRVRRLEQLAAELDT